MLAIGSTMCSGGTPLNNLSRAKHARASGVYFYEVLINDIKIKMDKLVIIR